MAHFTPADLELAQRRLALARAVAGRRHVNPAEWYEPSSPGQVINGRKCGRYANQLAFHRSTHVVRLLVPGNGWGKTTAMGAEAHAWGTHSNQWARTPAWPVTMLWFCKLEEQFDLIRAQLEETIFGSIATWTNGRYTWPDGSVLVLGLADKSNQWKKWMGVPADLILFDEEPPKALWKEMTMRRRARRKTRYVIGATAVSGETWMETTLYKPWLDHHRLMGLDEDRALQVQAHPRIFVWSRGGIEDNPAADDDDVAWYDESTADMHPKERKVRLTGGFAQWIGDAVFDDDALDWMELEGLKADDMLGAGILGMFDPEGERR